MKAIVIHWERFHLRIKFLKNDGNCGELSCPRFCTSRQITPSHSYSLNQLPKGKIQISVILSQLCSTIISSAVLTYARIPSTRTSLHQEVASTFLYFRRKQPDPWLGCSIWYDPRSICTRKMRIWRRCCDLRAEINVRRAIPIFSIKRKMMEHYLEDCDCLIKMMMFKRWCCINGSQGRSFFLHPRVRSSSVIQVMT